MVAVCTALFNYQQFCILPAQRMYVFVRISEQTVTISLPRSNRFFKTEEGCVYSAIGTGSL
jgi:hypothetical protein